MKNLKKRNPWLRSLRILLPVFIILLSNIAVAQHFQTIWSNNPYQAMNIIIDSASLDGAYLQLDDEIAVFDIDDSGIELCVGVIVMVGEFQPDTNYIIIASSDDPTTPDMDGFIQGHSIIYRYWDDSEAEEFVLFEVNYNAAMADNYQPLGTALAGLEGYTALTWTGASDNTWNNVANWSLSQTPDTATHVVIPIGLTNYPTLSAAGACNNLTLQSDSTGDASILGDNLLTVDGIVSVERYTSGGEWHDISAPVTGQTVFSIFMNDEPKVWLAQYNEPDNTRTYLPSFSTPMPSGAGFEMWVESGYDVTFSYEGPMQTSDLSLSSVTVPPISYTDPDHGYNLIGNPFASPIDLDEGTWAITDVSTSFWVWDPASASYKDWNTATVTGSLTDGIVPMGQGFFCQATGASASITIPMGARVHSSQVFYKNANAEETKGQMSLRTILENGYDEMNIAFMEEATEMFDTYDTRKMFAFDGNASQLYSEQMDELLSINGLPLLTEAGYSVRVGYRVGESGEHVLEANLENLPETEVILEDIVTGDRQSLTDQPRYIFDASTGDEVSRFILHFNPMTIGIDNSENENLFFIYAYNDKLYIKSSGTAAKEDKQVWIYDMMGKAVIQVKAEASTLTSIPVHQLNGYVLVKVMSEGRVETTKVFIK
jgi:hypothetical protein